MANTYNLSLPLVKAAQAQKHVTVNEALALLDAVAQLRVVSSAIVTPPSGATDGTAYIVPNGATGDWSGRDDDIAVFANGGWLFIQPKTGWQAWDEALGEARQYDGATWQTGGSSTSSGGAATSNEIFEVDHTLSSGATSTVSAAIPNGMVVLGVTARVITAISGSATGWSLGVSGSADRYGSGLGVGLNSFANGLTGQPQAYYADTDLILTAEGGSFAGGVVRLAVHGWRLQPPSAV